MSASKFWLFAMNFLASSCVSMAVDSLTVAEVLILQGASWMVAMSAATDESSEATNGMLAACVLMVAVYVDTNGSTWAWELVVAVSAATNMSIVAFELMVKDISLTFVVVCVLVGTAVFLMVMGSVAENFRQLS